MKDITLTLVIPVYNEGERIKKTLSILKQKLDLFGLKLTHIIFSDDGSTDNTLQLIQEEKTDIESALQTKVTILSYSRNKGRGYAVRFATLVSKTDYTLYTDADFSIPLSNLKQCLPYMKRSYDLVFGSKKMPGEKELIKRTLTRRIVGYGHSLIASTVLGITAWDYQGGFKLFSRSLVHDVFPSLRINRWGFDMEIIFLAKKYRFATKEVPVTWGHFENGSKVKLLRDIMRSLKEMALIKYYWLKGFYKPRVSSRFAIGYKQFVE